MVQLPKGSPNQAHLISGKGRRITGYVVSWGDGSSTRGVIKV